MNKALDDIINNNLFAQNFLWRAGERFFHWNLIFENNYNENG